MIEKAIAAAIVGFSLAVLIGGIQLIAGWLRDRW
jgi:hypothetical protein